MDSESFYMIVHCMLEGTVPLKSQSPYHSYLVSSLKRNLLFKTFHSSRECDTQASSPWKWTMYHYLHAEIHGLLSGPMRRLEPLTWQSLTACVLAGVCGLLNFLRCFPFLNIIVIDEEVRDRNIISSHVQMKRYVVLDIFLTQCKKLLKLFK